MTPLAGRWTLGEPVRRDGLGEVVWAVGPDAESVWLRVLPTRISGTPGLAGRLAAMPRVTARHLCAVLDSGVVDIDGTPLAYVAHAVEPGASDLSVLLQNGPLSPPVAARIVADVCWGLTAAHAAGLVHGTLSARDIVLTSDLRGSKVVGVGLFPLVREVLGTAPPRSAPEVRAGAAPTPASDLWSIGALLRQCLGEGAGAELPRLLQAELESLLQPDPANRPRSARAVATRLVGMATGFGGPPAVRPKPPAEPVPVPLAGEAVPEPPVPEPVPEPPVAPAPEREPEPAPVLQPVAGLDDDTGPLPVLAEPVLPPDPAGPLEVLEQLPPAHPAAWDDEVMDEDPRLRRLLIAASVAALLLVAAVLVLLHIGGTSSKPDRLTTLAASPGPSAARRTASGPSATTPASNPPPIVANPVTTDPVAAARLARIAVTAGDVGKGAKRQKIPDATDFNSYIRGVFATCDYYTPVGSPRTAHRVVRYDLPDGTEVVNDVTTYPVPAEQVVQGLKTSVSRCGALSLTEGGKVVGRFTLRAPLTPLPGLPTDAVELEYLSVEPADLPVRLVALAKGRTLDVVILRGPSSAGLLDPARKVVQSAIGRLSAVASG